MLVFTRHAGQSIRIGQDCVVRVEWIKDKRVRISVDAPREVRVMRCEIDREHPETQPQEKR